MLSTRPCPRPRVDAVDPPMPTRRLFRPAPIDSSCRRVSEKLSRIRVEESEELPRRGRGSRCLRGRNLDGAVRDGARPDRRVRRGLGLDEMTASGRNGYDRAERNRTMRGRSGPEGNRAGTGRARDWTRPNGAPRDWTARTGPDRIGRDTGRGQGSATRFYSRKNKRPIANVFAPGEWSKLSFAPHR